MVNQEAITIVRANIASLHALAKAAESVNHNGLKGKFREIFIQDILKDYMPPTVEALGGTIIFPDGFSREFRNEDDVVLYDHNKSPLLLKTSSRESIMSVTGVRAQIEVKSTLKLEDLNKAINAAIEINKHFPSNERFPKEENNLPIHAIFAFDTEIDKKSNIGELILNISNKIKYSPIKGEPTCPIQSICIVNHGCWLFTENKGKCGWHKVEAVEDREILTFISIVSNTLYGNGHGLGEYVFDTNWLNAPDPEMPLIKI
ncbi:MAG: hypothetical protein NTZ25_05410 [Candidatus Peregrinibacteria bacterium]|nr:hypothetical protein [Candidatus Peregrinibacteria bacterium]